MKNYLKFLFSLLILTTSISACVKDPILVIPTEPLNDHGTWPDGTFYTMVLFTTQNGIAAHLYCEKGKTPPALLLINATTFAQGVAVKVDRLSNLSRWGDTYKDCSGFTAKIDLVQAGIITTSDAATLNDDCSLTLNDRYLSGILEITLTDKTTQRSYTESVNCN